MAIKVIVELRAKPGKRTEVKDLLESVAATLGPREPAFLGSTRYEVARQSQHIG
jgi:quinol monooxygenase YgiN